VTNDTGATWRQRPAPTGPDGLCTSYTGSYTGIAVAGPASWWLLCTGGAAAGSSTKALLHTTNGGRTWRVAAAVTSLVSPGPPGSLPRADAVALAASPTRLWLAGPNALVQSGNGGVAWTTAAFNPAGTFGSFDVLSATTAWLLAPGTGLWTTTDGTTWSIG
jgi:hypothetical protein